MTGSTSKKTCDSGNKILTTAVGNAELYADMTSPRKLQALSEKKTEKK